MNRTPRYEIYIGELGINGFETTDREGIAEGLRSGLERAFTHPELVGRLVEYPDPATIDAGPIDIPVSASGPIVGESAGDAAARAIVGRSPR
jgi:hypothetical protein